MGHPISTILPFNNLHSIAAPVLEAQNFLPWSVISRPLKGEFGG
jgi:hypothetical protein